MNACVIVPLYFGRAPAGRDGPRLRILSFNVLAHNPEYDKVRDFIKSESPDVAVFFEADSRWPPELSQLADLYPYQKFRPQEGHMGVALLSRIPFEHAEFHHLDPACPAGLMRFRIGDRPVTIIATHVFPPTAAWKTARRNAQLEEVAKLVRAETNPVIVIGDYNATSWSSAFRQLRNSTGLRDSRRGFGVQPSWPAQARLLRIPIDHCLTSHELRVLNRRLGPGCGSDHLPVIVDLAF